MIAQAATGESLTRDSCSDTEARAASSELVARARDLAVTVPQCRAVTAAVY